MNTLPLRDGGRRGSALLVTLAFLLLLTVLVVGFIARSVLEVQLSTGSASQSKVDLAAQGAAASVITDLQAEIVAGSVAPTTTPPVYLPTSNLTMIPSYGIGFTPGTGLENLLKISKNTYPFWSASITSGGPMRASSVSTTTPSLNYRSISLARWNKALMVARMSPNDATDTTPISTFLAPDWIYVARDGSNPVGPALDSSFTYSANVPLAQAPQTGVRGSNPVLQRYAYAIYDEGSTLDMNVAGSPVSGTSANSVTYAPLAASTAPFQNALAPFKGALAYADLSQLPPLAKLPPSQQMSIINAVVGWRNYATAQVTNSTFPGPYTFSPATSSALSPYDVFIAQNPSGFMNVGSTALASSTGLGSGPKGPQSDNVFTSRQQLIQFFMDGLGSNASLGLTNPQATFANLLPYLGTFSRDLEQPSYIPPPLQTNSYPAIPNGRPNVQLVINGGNSAAPDYPGNNGPQDDLINSPFLGQTTTGVGTAVSGGAIGFTRSDGSLGVGGEPLVKKRFALSRLAWLTCKGPIADDSGNLNTDPVIQSVITQLENLGVSESLLKEGGPTNIKKYFGLTWDTAGSLPLVQPNRWLYNVHNGATGTGPTGAINKLSDIAKGAVNAHDPDFFELLKGTINVGSLGRTITNSATYGASTYWNDLLNPGSITNEYDGLNSNPIDYQYARDISVDYQIIQIGANIIEQANVTGFPVRIGFDDGRTSSSVPAVPGGITEFQGAENLPYLYRLHYGVVQLKQPLSSPGSTPYTQTSYGSMGPATTPAVADTGLGAYMQIPTVWNPYDVNASRGAPNLYPTKFQVKVDSTSPDKIGNSAYYDSYYCYSYWSGTSFSPPSMTDASFGADPGGPNATKIGFDYESTTSSTAGRYKGNTLNSTSSPIMGGASPGSVDSTMSFTDTNASTGDLLFRQPTLLFKPNLPANGNLAMGPNNPFSSANMTGTGSSPYSPTGYLLSYLSGAMGTVSPEPSPRGNYIGILMGVFPLRWQTTIPPVPPAVMPTINAYTGDIAVCTRFDSSKTSAATDDTFNCFLTYRLQCQDAYNNYIDYDTKYLNTWAASSFTGNLNFDVPLTCSMPYVCNNAKSIVDGTYGADPVNSDPSGWSSSIDPRTSRWGMITTSNAAGSMNEGFGLLVPENFASSPGFTNNVRDYIDPGNGIMETERPDQTSGFAHSYYPINFGYPSFSTGLIPPPATMEFLPREGWSTSYAYFPFVARLGMYSQNNPNFSDNNLRFVGEAVSDINSYYGGLNDYNTDYNPQYYADADGVVRRAMGAFVWQGPVPGTRATVNTGTPTSVVGLPLARCPDYPGGSYPIVAGVPNYPSQSNTNGIDPNPTDPNNQWQSRPYMLHRPFRSVAELGYVFSGTPWKNLDFFTPESPDCALLDVFCINEVKNPTGLVSGKINLNTRQTAILQAVLAGAYKDDPKFSLSATQINNGSITSEALSIAEDLVTRTSVGNTNTKLANGGTLTPAPLTNLSDLVGKWSQGSAAAVKIPPQGQSAAARPIYYTFVDGNASYDGFSKDLDNLVFTPGHNAYKFTSGSAQTSPYNNLMLTPQVAAGTAPDLSSDVIQRFHEAPVRALSAVGTTRVWNLMIDLIAQTGRFPANTSSLASFSTEGERRYWIHVAIDRYTGKVLDEQIEVVKE